MITQICETNRCTGCRACEAVCPKRCISMHPNEYGVVLPKIDYDLCIECKKCINTCPNNKICNTNKPIKCFAGWSNDDETRRTSASGGIASEIYRYCNENRIASTGCVIENISDCFLKIIKPGDSYGSSRNSKYVYSSTGETYKEAATLLKNGEKVIFIGLPCQISGLKNYLGKDYDNLITVDIVCHGVAPREYLRQHVDSRIGKINGLEKISVSFRNPELDGGTSKYWFTIATVKNNILYAKRVYDNDEYQHGYHKALIYRENCYNCRYAKKERVGDLTISDFSGLGKLAPWKQDKQNVSCILVNTKKGEQLLDALGEQLHLEERPLDEALKFEHQLSHPSVPHPRRNDFLNRYAETNDFDGSVRFAVGRTLLKNHIKVLLHVENLRTLLSRMTPSALKRTMRSILKK